MNQNKHVYVICCWPEVAGDVVSGENVRTIEGYALLNFEVSEFSGFSNIQKNLFVAAAEAAVDIDDSITRKRIRVFNQII